MSSLLRAAVTHLRIVAHLHYDTERDSPKSHVLVILFIIVTSVLLVGAVLKTYGIDIQAILQQGGFRGLLQVRSVKLERVEPLGSQRRSSDECSALASC